MVVATSWLTTAESAELEPSDPAAHIIAKRKYFTQHQLSEKSTEGITYNKDTLTLLFSLALVACSALCVFVFVCVCWLEFS